MDNRVELISLIPQLSIRTIDFPDPMESTSGGLVAFGGDLSPARLLEAYRRGIFPWYTKDQPILWWSPDPRLILIPGTFKVRKSFRKVLKNRGFEVRFDERFSEVISWCKTIPRKEQRGTWITDEVKEAYERLHALGYAHSVEVYLEGDLVGGLYGVSLGNAFFGESMFSRVKDASKVAFKALSDTLAWRGYDLIDCQMPTEHMKRLGAVEVSKLHFFGLLEQSLEMSTKIGKWSDFRWEYQGG